MESELTPVFALDLDWDLIQHLPDPEAVDLFRSEHLSPDLIEDDLARSAFVWQLEHFRQHGQPATASVLEDEFSEVSLTHPETTAGDLIQRLRERYMRNESRRALKEMAKLAGTDPLAVSGEMLRVGRTLNDLTSERGAHYTIADLERARTLYDKKVLTGPGPTLGFTEIDNHFGGIKGMTFLVAAPKSYKSWITVNAVLESAINGERPYLYSLELPAEDTDMRLRCMAANVPFWKYERNALTPQDWADIKTATDAILSQGMYEVDKPPPGERDAHNLVERAMAVGASAIYIDQLQYIEDGKGNNLGALNDTGYYWKALSVLRDYSDEIPIFVVHQFNRSVQKAKEMPDMQQAKGSSAIEEIGHLVLGLWANKEMRKNNVVELGTLASRSYSYNQWHIDVQLTKGCRFDMIGEVDDEEEE
jgi:replicative DNA helicase